MRRAGFFAAALLLAATLFAAPFVSTAQPPAPDPDPARVMREAGVGFPDRLGNFSRTQISSVGQGHAGATYLIRDDGQPGVILVDIFVGPVTTPLAAEFAGTERVIARLNQNLTLVRDLPAPARAPGALGRLWRGELGGQPVLTAMYLWHHQGWRIKIRATLDAARGEAGWAEVERLVEAFAADAVASALYSPVMHVPG